MESEDRAGGPVVVAIVGVSGAGKTTLITRLVPILKDRGVSVGVIKHHHLTTGFDVPGKDTDRIFRSGAAAVVGVSPLQTAVFHPRQARQEIESVVDEYLGGVDLVLAEGYKHGPFEKIEVHRSAVSRDLVCAPSELTALVSDVPWDVPVPQFGPDSIVEVAEYLEAEHVRS